MKKLILFYLAAILGFLVILITIVSSNHVSTAKYKIWIVSSGVFYYCDSYELEGGTIRFKSLTDGKNVRLSGTYIIYERK